VGGRLKKFNEFQAEKSAGFLTAAGCGGFFLGAGPHKNQGKNVRNSLNLLEEVREYQARESDNNH